MLNQNYKGVMLVFNSLSFFLELAFPFSMLSDVKFLYSVRKTLFSLIWIVQYGLKSTCWCLLPFAPLCPPLPLQQPWSAYSGVSPACWLCFLFYLCHPLLCKGFFPFLCLAIFSSLDTQLRDDHFKKSPSTLPYFEGDFIFWSYNVLCRLLLLYLSYCFIAVVSITRRSSWGQQLCFLHICQLST